MSEQAKDHPGSPATEPAETRAPAASETAAPRRPKEIGGREGPEPVRFGDWEKNGRCIDF